MTVKTIFYDIRYVVFFIVLYVFIYNPPFSFLPLMPIEVILIISIIYLTIFGKWNNLLYLFKYELLLLFLIIIFCLIREIGSPKSVFFRANVFLLLQVIVLPYFVVLLYRKIEKRNNLLKEIVILGFVASLITIVLLVFPSLGDSVRYNILKVDEYTELVAFRTFGLSEGLTFAYGTVQGLIFALAAYYSRYNSKYLLVLPFIFLSVLFNARIGLIPIAFSLVYFVIIKFNVKAILVSLIVGFSFYVIIFKTEIFSEYAKTIEWAFDFFTQSSDFLSGTGSSETNNFNVLFEEMAVIPKDLKEWLIGTGENIFLSEKANSDIGYLIQLNYGGLIYLALFATFISFLIWRLRFLYKRNKWLILLILITIVLTNIKGIFVSIIPSFRLIMLVYCYLIMEYKKGLNENEESYNLISFGVKQ